MTNILHTLKHEFLKVLPPTIFFFFTINIITPFRSCEHAAIYLPHKLYKSFRHYLNLLSYEQIVLILFQHQQ